MRPFEARRDEVSPPFLRTKWGLFPITILAFSLVFLLSSTAPVERSLAEEIYSLLMENIPKNPIDVFLHNFGLSMIMTIPVLGFVFSMISSATTGVAVSALSTLNNLNPLSLAIGLISSPVGMVEFIAYGIASAQSLASLFAIAEKRMTKELKGYASTILIVVVLLLVAALLEWSLVAENLT